MNERIRQLVAQSQKVVGHTDGGYTEIKVLDQEKFVQRILAECISTIKHESSVQLDTEFGIIYSRAIAARFGFTLDHPFLTVTLKEQL